jgi:hypothetical protein
MEKLTQESVDKAVELLKTLGVSESAIETVKKELDAKCEKEDSADMTEPGDKEEDAAPAAEAPKKGMPFTAFGSGKNAL